MRRVTVHHYDAFSIRPGMGNPAGIVAGENLNDWEMQEIAKRIGFNETVFLFPSEKADLSMRYFTPGHETPLCGHATMAGVSFMRREGRIPDLGRLLMETGAGLLSLESWYRQEVPLVTMEQARPSFIPFAGDTTELAAVLDIEVTDIEPGIPIVYGNTGSWTLLVPIRSLDAFTRMHPRNADFPIVLDQMPRSSIHPFCLETRDQGRHIHSRHFSSPYSGTVEDPVTGTASGVIGAYWATWLDQDASELNLVMEQGHEIGRDGEVLVRTVRDAEGLRVYVSGTAVPVRQIMVDLPDPESGMPG